MVWQGWRASTLAVDAQTDAEASIGKDTGFAFVRRETSPDTMTTSWRRVSESCPPYRVRPPTTRATGK